MVHVDDRFVRALLGVVLGAVFAYVVLDFVSKYLLIKVAEGKL